MDWGLLQVNKQKDKSGNFLRSSTGDHLYERSKNYPLRDILFAPVWMYYTGMIANFLLRLAWVVNISPTVFGFTMKQYFSIMAFSLMEVLRRSIWNFFRVENEHSVNCKTHRPIQLVPYTNARVIEMAVASAMDITNQNADDESEGEMHAELKVKIDADNAETKAETQVEAFSDSS
jgi:hypothetical protein